MLSAPLPTIHRILVIKWSAMGDVAIAGAAIEDLHQAYPQAEIDLSTLPPWDKLYSHDPRISNLIAINVRGKSQWLALWRWLKTVSARRYDLVIDLQTTDRSRALLSALWLFGAQIARRAGNRPVFPYNLPRAQLRGNALQISRDTLASAGVSPKATRPVLHCSKTREPEIRQLLRDHGVVDAAYAIFFPGSQAAGYLKRWGAARYVELGNKLHTFGLKQILIIGGPDEIDECQAIALAAPAWAINLCGQTELLDIVPIAAGARFLVGNDTGTAHVASTSSNPMLIICGPTDPARVLPAGENVNSLQADLPCINCYQKTCSHHSCMSWVTPDMVIEKLRAMHALVGLAPAT